MQHGGGDYLLRQQLSSANSLACPLRVSKRAILRGVEEGVRAPTPIRDLESGASGNGARGVPESECLGSSDMPIHGASYPLPWIDERAQKYVPWLTSPCVRSVSPKLQLCGYYSTVFWW